ncbi:MAG: hypothetical protein OEQ39_12705 [Gammaproteobacteria bacterium]|nr:hypothetical protein [Gammaproteobacteria bacterium]
MPGQRDVDRRSITSWVSAHTHQRISDIAAREDRAVSKIAERLLDIALMLYDDTGPDIDLVTYTESFRRYIADVDETHTMATSPRARADSPSSASKVHQSTSMRRSAATNRSVCACIT